MTLVLITGYAAMLCFFVLGFIIGWRCGVTCSDRVSQATLPPEYDR